MEFRILGSFEVTGPDGPLELGGARQRLLLARLAVAANRVVPLDALLDKLWGGAPPAGAKDAFQAQVSRARKCLGDPPRLLTRAPGYELRLGPDELDAARFEALVARARAAAAAGDLTVAAADLAEAEAVWRGPALAEFADYPFAQAEAARLEDLRLEAVEERIEADLALGRHGVLTGELKGLVAAHPFRERLCAQWMLALYRAGRQTEALRAYNQLRRRLGEELGIDPGSEVVRLEEAILLHKPELDWEPPCGMSTGRPATTTTAAAVPFVAALGPGRVRSLLVGRRTERAALLDLLDAAADGRPSIVVVAGEAGVGKTRLVAEVADAAAATGAVVLAGGSADLGGTDVPYAPLAEAFRRHLRSLEPDDAAALVAASAGALARLVPELDDGDRGAVVSDPARLHGLIVRVLRHLTAATPAVLILEDLQWADPSTASALEFVARNVSDERLMVLATVRIDELGPRRPTGELVAALERCRAVRRMDLLRLGDGDVAELVAALVEHGPAGRGQDTDRPGAGQPERRPATHTDDLVRRVVARSEGNPLFVEELVAGHQEGDGLRPTLRDLLVTRVESLNDAAIDCARLLAVAGRPLSHALLASASALGQGELLGGLRQAVDRHVVVAEADGYRFRHALVGEALYDHLLPGERAALHARLAAALAALPAEGSAAERARHWVASGDAGQALAAHVRAATVAEQALAFSEALTSWESALALWDQVEDPTARTGFDRAALLERAGEAASRSERPRHAGASAGSQRAAELTEAALGHVDPGRDPIRAGLLHGRLASHLWTAGRDGRAHADAALRLVPPEPPSPERARIMADCARGAIGADSAHEAAAFAGEAIRLAQALGDANLESDARTTLGAARTLVGQPDEAEAELRAALRLAERAGFADGVMRAFHSLTGALLYDDRTEEALSVLDDECAAGRRLGLEDVFAPRQLVRRAECLRVLGRWDEAEEVLDTLDRRWPRISFRLHELAFLAGARGDAGALGDVLAAAADLGAAARSEMQPLYRAQAELSLWRDRPADARQVVTEALDHLSGVDVPRIVAPLLQLGIRAEADLAEQGAARAADVASVLHERLVALTRSSHVRSTTAIAATGDAELTRVEGPVQPERWRRAVTAWEAVGNPYPLAYVRWRMAEALLASGGSRVEAIALVQASRTTATRLRLAPLLQRLALLTAGHEIRGSLAATDPGRPPEPTGYTVSLLSHREGVRADDSQR